MQEKHIIVHKGRTLYYPTHDEAVKMARFIGFPVANIKVVHIY